MYRYTGSGLRNVWLVNGFSRHKTPYGMGIAISDVAGLHRLIGRQLVVNPRRLTGAEFRFLRKEQELSQKRLGELIGANVQAINRWETGKTRVPQWADHFARVLYRQYSEGSGKVREIIDAMNAQDTREHAQLKFRLRNRRWMAKERQAA